MMNTLLQPGSDNGHTYEDWEDDLDIVEEISPSFSLRGAGDRDHESFSRYLMEGRRNTDGTLAVLMIVFALFCFIWAPVMLRRCRGHGHHSATDEIHDLARFEAEARAVRATLQRMSMLNGVLGGEARGDNSDNDPQLQHRKEFLDNALLTKKVIFQSTSSSSTDSEDADDKTAEKNDNKTGTNASSPSSKPAKERKPPRRQKSNVIVLVNTTRHKKKEPKEPDSSECDSKSNDEACTERKESTAADKNETGQDDNNDGPDPGSSEDSIISSKAAVEVQPSDLECNNAEEINNDSQLEPCSICLTEYNDGDEICWSHNDKCNHFFHKSCIQTWLLTHEECPCCRQDFLCLWSDDEDDEDDDNNNTRLAWSRRGRHSQQSSSTTPDLDWAEELAEEIQQRILQRQRQLQAELHRRERQERMMQFQRQLQLSSSPAALSNPGATALQSGVTQPRNTVISLDDTAASLLLFRHFPTLHHHFASEQLATTFGAGGHTINNNDDGDEDVQVSHFAAGGPTWGPSYRPDLPVVVRTSPGSSSVFEMVDRSSRRRRLLRPGDHPHSPSRSLTTTSSSSSNNERTTAEGNNEGTVTSSQPQQSAGRREDGHNGGDDANNNNNNMTTASA